MNDEDAPGAEDGGEGFGREAGPRQTRGAGSDLPGILEQFRQTSAWLTSVDKALEPARRHIRMMESARRTVESVMGPGTVYQVALDAQRQYRAVTEPVLALQSSLSDIYDWHSRINDVVRSVSLPRALLERLAATAALFLPANLGGLDTEELRTILEMGGDDGLSLAWAPRTGIVKALLPLGTRQERYALLAERRDDVLDDIDASLRIVTHPELTGMVAILSAATRTARAGFGEGAQALAGNVLESAMSRHGNAWIRRSFPQVAYPSRAGHHGTIGSALDDAEDWGDLTLLQFKHYLVVAGMRNAFGPGATQDTFNRHLGAHQASPDTYRPEFVLPAILLAHALLRALNQDLERPGDDEDNA
ncbi:hypothetical protein ACG5V6_24215 [Streptomyces chitinivorans]|uniref:Uncharacterized protein n=1 Tax=Streptomyces chitinivorans TaxID=1257027 RepID=A0ABW7HZJ9_9ACTN|nr:hypothetical protein [Streptomyces chitinivorans]MDH2412369.1 hypothetical protein [Streptomyces chitinivorans]